MNFKTNSNFPIIPLEADEVEIIYHIVIYKITAVFSDKDDKDRLLQSLRYAKEILADVNRQVGAYEREQRLLEIYNKVDARSTAVFKGKKFKVSQGQMSVQINHVTSSVSRGQI